ncbi:MAG: C1 family peptidase [Candidatus Eisenbacteria bacterium]
MHHLTNRATAPVVALALTALVLMWAAAFADDGAAPGDLDVPMSAEQAEELAAIREAIEREGAHWVAEPNYISLLPKDEFRKMLGGGWPTEVQAIFDTLRPRDEDLERDYPAYWDWREVGGTTPVKDQGSCGSCWDFAATGALEGNLRVMEGVVYDLSEQQGLDCNDGGSSCDGGWQGDTYEVFTDPGAVTEECMPYLAHESTCRQRTCEKVAIMDGYQYVAGNVNSYKAALMVGPISACYTVYEDFNEYNGGCYQHVWGGYDAGHCIVIVGWDDSMCGGNGAWICKNSWGGGWGVGGYFYIKYGDSGIGYGAERPLNAHIRRERLVPDEFASIQSAIDNSNRGDIIRIAGGTYYENVVVDDYCILYGGYDPTFQVRDLDLYPTVIDAGGAGHGVVVSGERNVVLDGFEIRNATGGTRYGVYVTSSEVDIRNCEIHDCYTGIYVGGSSIDRDAGVERCIIRDNEAHGIHLSGEVNTAVNVLLTACYGNGGDGVYSSTSPVNILNCTLSANDGDGFDLRWTNGNEVKSSIICENGGYGLTTVVATPDNAYNCVWGNASGDYNGPSPGAGSFSSDPIFCDAPGGDVRVHATSPTLGAGQAAEDMGALGIGCPAGPSGLSVAQNGARLDLSWDPPPASRAPVGHYVVYRDTTQYHATQIATVAAPATTFTDITIPPCVTHNYWVSSVDTAGLEGAVSNRGYSQLCYGGPTGLAVAFDAGGNELSWSGGTGSIDSYTIMRYTVVDPADSVGSVYAPATDYVDASIYDCPRENYTYEVVPVYDTGWHGQSSESVTVDPAPAAPAALSAEWSGSDCVLTWSPNCESDFRRYWVYRDTMPLSPPPRHDFWIGQTTDTTYVDVGLNTNWNYFYRLVSSDASSYKSGYSEMAYVADPQARHVPAQYATIQAAIDASSPPDTVFVAPGTYYENVLMKDGVSVVSTGGRAETAISSSAAPVVNVTGMCDLTLLRGFEVDGQSVAATGLECWGSYARVEDCAFRNCTTGADFKSGGAAAMEGCVFDGNQNGVVVADSAAPFLSASTFDGNSFAAVSSGGVPGPEIGRTLSDANDFLNKGLFYLFNTGAATLNADYNFWDDACVDPAWFYGPVDYSPWTDSAHTEVLTVCTGVPSAHADRPYASVNYPNPFNPSTSISYVVPASGARVTIVVYDLSGRVVRTLVDGEKPAGEHAAVWLGRDDGGSELASGVYFYRVRIGEYSTERKMLLLK